MGEVTPKRIQRKRTQGWRMPENAVYVGRPSRWGNPFRVKGGRLIGPEWPWAQHYWTFIPAGYVDIYYMPTGPVSQQLAVDMYASLMRVRERDKSERLAEWLTPLRGNHLACWCPLDQPCHADVLLDLANRGAAQDG